MTRVLVLLSGGLDSAVALYWALNRGYVVETLTFNYHQRSKKEIRSSKEIAKRTRTRNTLIDLSFLEEIEDSKKKNENPLLRYAPCAYIPGRNMIFYGIASSLAEVMDAKYIVGGHNKNDTRSFPDSSRNFFSMFNRTACVGKISKGRTGRVILPLATLNKTQIVRLGEKLDVPYQLTWSCYASYKKPCQSCPACLLRAEAFSSAGLIDPIMAAT